MWRVIPSGRAGRCVHADVPASLTMVGREGIYEYKRVGLRLGCPERYVLRG